MCGAEPPCSKSATTGAVPDSRPWACVPPRPSMSICSPVTPRITSVSAGPYAPPPEWTARSWRSPSRWNDWLVHEIGEPAGLPARPVRTPPMTPKATGMGRAGRCEGAHPALVCIRKRGASPSTPGRGTAEALSPRLRTQAGLAHRGDSWTSGKAVSTHFVEPDHATGTHCQPPTLGRLTQLLGLDRNNAAPSTPMQLNTSNVRESNPFPKGIPKEPPKVPPNSSPVLLHLAAPAARAQSAVQVNATVSPAFSLNWQPPTGVGVQGALRDWGSSGSPGWLGVAWTSRFGQGRTQYRHGPGDHVSVEAP
jgi:hypothetical protein